MTIDPRVARFVFAATAIASLLMGASGYFAVFSLLARHGAAVQVQAPASDVHRAQLMPYESAIEPWASRSPG